MRQDTSLQKFKISETQKLGDLVTRCLGDSVSLNKSRSDDSFQAGGEAHSAEPLQKNTQKNQSAEGATELWMIFSVVPSAL